MFVRTLSCCMVIAIVLLHWPYLIYMSCDCHLVIAQFWSVILTSNSPYAVHTSGCEFRYLRDNHLYMVIV